MKDAEVLLGAKRFDGAVYICGYVVEIALKARICRTMKWSEYPSNSGEFRRYQSFRTHDLDVLLHLSGAETGIKTKNFAEWSLIATWDPSTRYRPVGSASAQDAQDMVASAKAVLGAL